MLNNHQNPGTTNPADQAYPAAANPQTAPTQASASATSSDGELQLPAMQAAQAEPSATRGLPDEVHAGSTSQVRKQPPRVVENMPPARDVQAGSHHPGGLPVNVYIR